MVVDLDGPPCPGDCPGHGCLEWYASGTALGRAGQRARDRRSPTRRSAASWRRAARSPARSSPSSRTTATRGARGASPSIGPLLGLGLAGLVNVFNPEVIVIGGGAIGAGELLLDPAREVARGAGAAAGRATSCASCRPRFGAEAGMLGAATLAFEELVR